MNFAKKNIKKIGIVGIILLFLLILVFFVLKSPKEKPILSRNGYRIFACGEEIFLKADQKSLTKKRNGLFSQSKPGDIVASGTFSNIDDILLTSFFDAAGGTLEFSDEQKNIFRIPTETGLREFKSGDLCNGKRADLYVIHHRVETLTKPYSIYSRIMWKYFDQILTNNYGKVPPGDCFIFIFDSEDVLENPWPRCASHEDALASGDLILTK